MSLSDPLRAPGKTPRRAEPLQPDRPDRGADQQSDDESPAPPAADESDKKATDDQIEQSRTALDNVRNP